MSTEAQRATNDVAVKRAIGLAANGNPEAARYLEIIAGAARVLDDIVDGDRPVQPGAAIAIFQQLLIEIHGNGFFMRHREALTLAHMVALNAWLDANALAGAQDRTVRGYAHVVRDQINELLPAVAYLTGGWQHVRKLSLPELRAPFFKPFKED